MTGCVLPGEFDAVDNDCAQPAFDVETRDAFCSGSVSSRVVHRESGFAASEKPLVQIQGNFISIVEPFDFGEGFTVRVLKTNDGGQSYDPVLEEEVFVPNAGPLTSFTVMGLRDGDQNANNAVLALVYDEETLRFVDFERLNDAPEPGGDDGSPGIFDLGSDELVSNEARVAFGDDCDPDARGNKFPLTDIASLSPPGFEDRQFLMVAARCAMLVYAQGNNVVRPQLLTQFPLKAVDIEVDRAGDRLFVASGLEGLQVRGLTDFESDLNDLFGPMNLEADGDPSACPEGENCGPDDDVAFAPRLAGEEGFESDPSIRAIMNVTKVAYSGDRVFFLNAPTETGQLEDRLTYLVTGKLTPTGLLESRTSIALADSEDFEWDLAGLEGSLVAVLRTRRVELEGQTGASSVITLFDAPKDATPTFATQLPVTGEVQSIEFKDGEVWAIQKDQIVAFDVKVGGEPL